MFNTYTVKIHFIMSKYLHEIPATAFSLLSSSSHKFSEASSYWSVNLQVT